MHRTCLFGNKKCANNRCIKLARREQKMAIRRQNRTISTFNMKHRGGGGTAGEEENRLPKVDRHITLTPVPDVYNVHKCCVYFVGVEVYTLDLLNARARPTNQTARRKGSRCTNIYTILFITSEGFCTRLWSHFGHSLKRPLCLCLWVFPALYNI